MTVTTLSLDQVVEIVSVLSDAFQDYPVMRYVLGPDIPGMGAPYKVRLHRLVQLFVSARAYRDEPLLGVRDGSGALVAAAVVSLPKASNPLPAFIALREAVWAELGAEARSRYDAYIAAANFFASMPPHHHLNMIGVRRAQQRTGLSRELLESVHRLASEDPDSPGVSLTTERHENIPFYEHFGYEVAGHARVGPDLETWGLFRASTGILAASKSRNAD